ncbi:MAG TPA: hypothetical protein VH599_19150, partial [Ktedonobacterales bacterium]
SRRPTLRQGERSPPGHGASRPPLAAETAALPAATPDHWWNRVYLIERRLEHIPQREIAANSEGSR